MSEPEAVGDCYESACKFLLENCSTMQTLTLVHAVCLLGGGPMEGQPFGHAWCEVTETNEVPENMAGIRSFDLVWCLDHSNGRDIRLPQALYYMGGRPTQIHRYSPAEAREWLLRVEHWGHWELDTPR